jgi:uncharacterized protein YeaO (DUF488 family)
MKDRMTIGLKRVYEKPAKSDGRRILVERLWPRGLTKEAARIDLWMKEVSPSPALRQWYAHDPEKWREFQRRYLAELATNKAAVEALTALVAKEPTTFVFAARDAEKNSAVVLKSFVEATGRAGRKQKKASRIAPGG